MSQIAIILVHKGSADPESKKLLDLLKDLNIEGITKINANNPKVKQHLESNISGVVVKKYPSFLVAQKGKTTQIYSSHEVDTVLEILEKITNRTTDRSTGTDK